MINISENMFVFLLAFTTFGLTASLAVQQLLANRKRKKEEEQARQGRDSALGYGQRPYPQR